MKVNDCGLGQVEIVAAVAARGQLEHTVGERHVGILLPGVAGNMRALEPQPIDDDGAGRRERDGVAGRPGQHGLPATCGRPGNAGIGAHDRERLVDGQVLVVGARPDDDGVAGRGRIDRGLDGAVAAVAHEQEVVAGAVAHLLHAVEKIGAFGARGHLPAGLVAGGRGIGIGDALMALACSVPV